MQNAKQVTQVKFLKAVDENFLRGLPMLFNGFAASWWQGVKHSVITWKDAVELLRSNFPKKPPHRIYRELFATEQDSKTPTDVFVCKARALLAQLP